MKGSKRDRVKVSTWDAQCKHKRFLSLCSRIRKTNLITVGGKLIYDSIQCSVFDTMHPLNSLGHLIFNELINSATESNLITQHSYRSETRSNRTGV